MNAHLMRRTIAAVAIALAGALPAGFASAADSDVIARIGTTDITAADVRSYIEGMDPREQTALARDPAMLSQVVRMILARQIVLKEALAKKWDQQPQVIAEIARARDAAIAESYLQSVSKPPEGYPSEAEIQTAYEANKTAFLVPRQFQLEQMFVPVAKDADKAAQDAAHRKIDEWARKLRRNGGDIDAVEQAEGGDKDAAKKRDDLGWIYETQIAPDIKSQVIGLAKGDMTEPLHLDDGWHIIKLVDTKAAYTKSLNDVHDQLAHELRAERAQANRRAYMAKLLQQNPPAINELALSGLLEKTDK